MKTILKFKLNPKYRDPISLEAEESVFGGREKEINRLRNLVRWRKSATVLVGGVRGIGKTSFVREALRLVKTKDKKEFSVIDLTFANVEKKSEDLRCDILKALIRGLYLNNKVRIVAGNLLEELYDKSYYLELIGKGILETSKQEIVNTTSKEIKERVLRLDFLETFSRILGSGFFLYLLITLLKFFSVTLNWWQLLLFFLVGGIIVFLIMVKMDFKKASITSVGFTDKIKEKISKSGIAKYDLSADTLEIGLRQVLCELSKNGNKVIFTIDELDKIDDEMGSDKNLTEHHIYKVIKSLKNLFSLSDAIFIFITSAEFFDLIEDQKRIKPYSSFHTLFTDKIFLPPLYYRDVDNIIDGFVSGEVDEQYKDNYEKFKNFISWKAKNHIFDTHNLIEDYTVYEKDEELCLHIYRGDELQKGNIEDFWEKAAALQNFISATYDEKLYPNEPRKNEKLYLVLREVCDILYRDDIIEIVDNKFLETILKEDRDSLGINNLDENTQDDLSGAIEDLLLRTERYNFTDSIRKSRKIGDPPEDKKVLTFSTKKDYAYPDLEEIKKKNSQTDFEKDLLGRLKALEKIRENLLDVNLDTFDAYEDEYEKLFTIAEPIKQERVRKRRKSQILSDINRMHQIIVALKTEALNDLTGEIVSELQLTSRGVAAEPPTQPMQNEDPSLSIFYQYISDNLEKDKDYTVLGKDDKYILAGYNLGQEIQDEYMKVPLDDRRKTAKTRVINILYKGTQNKKGQWKVFKVRDDFEDLGRLKNDIKQYLKQYLK